jgi:AraC family transcriptional regulator of adaptative response/methylated-DNA-[protein]-cysteine methyltransferase
MAPDQPLRVFMIGTDFEVRVWETLLKIPLGRATTYSTIAGHIGKPKAARAVGAAVGATRCPSSCRAIACWANPAR